MSTANLAEGASYRSMTETGDRKEDRRKRFEAVFPVIAEELLGYIRGEGMPVDAVEWFEKVGHWE